MVDAGALLQRLRAETDTMVAAIERLAAIDSGSGDDHGITRVCEAFADVLTTAGFVVRPRAEGGLGAALTLPGTGGGRVLLLGHADTVWPSGTAATWASARGDGMLHGPGVGDMKGCLVMAAHAAAAARDAGALAGVGEVELLVIPDEELGSVASRPWIEERAAGAAGCLGLEAGWPGGGVVVERGAVGAVTVIAAGRTAHAAGHEGRGASAVAALAPLVTALEALSRSEEDVLVSVGVFRGGVARQVVPDHAELSLDLRAPNQERADALMDAVTATVRDAHAPEITLTLSGGITRPAWPRSASAWLWERARDRAAQLNVPLEAVSSRGGSDASFAAALGVPTLDGLGPICHDSCARGERIEIASLAERAALMALLIADLGAQARDSGNVDAPA
ncbi:MAG TPA: M20/M25/M40 family metallo-hydrolase [Solirubrobacteraceae bacterium]|jgi:glutamate carboxypeptidase|nr:M20/M25/M40 family metallo-hydrolase [Solirubrobacteraceae bacterium]